MNNILKHHIRKNPPRSQEDCVAFAVRYSLAAYGEMTDDAMRKAACHGIAGGLFGPAWTAADLPQKLRWYKMAKRQYEIATART